MKSLQFVEIDIPFCALRYGETTDEGTCPAVLGVDSAAKCHNTKNTCPVRASYIEDDVTLRFAKPTAYLPKEIDCIPSVQEISFTPATISLGENLGTRATLTATFFDHKDSDTAEGLDKYVTERDYNPFEQGTFWGKFRARQPFLRGRAIRWITGLEEQALEEMETRHFVLESFDGPTPDGKYTLVAKDVLKLVDGDRAMAPAASTGFLVAPITSGASSATLSPSGVGDAEYRSEGYLAIGGKEIVAFQRWEYDPEGENDAFTKIMLHLDGANGSTAFTDDNAGGSSHSWSATGPASISTASSVFGGASLIVATGVGTTRISTPAHADFALGSGDWTLDFRFNPNGSSGAAGIIGQDSSGGTYTNCSFFIQRTSGNKLQLNVSSGSAFFGPTSTTNFNDSTWRHIEICRSGNVLKLFVGGVQEGGNVAFSGSIPTSSGGFAVGRAGDNTALQNAFNARFDEVRFSVGVARHTSNFTPPSAAYVSTDEQISTHDVLNLTARGQLGGGVAQAFNAQDRVQVVLKYTAADPADIIYDLMVNYADVPADFINLSDWQTETGDFLGRLYSAVIVEPTSVATLISELIQQAGLCIWWDDINRKIRLQVLRGIVTDAARFTPDNMIAGSFTVKEQQDKRISQVLDYFGQINPFKQLSDLDNYRSSSLIVDAEAEADYGGAVIKKIMSRWIPALGRTVADRLGTILLSRYRDPPRKFTFDLSRYAQTAAQLGGGYRIASHCLQDETGALIDVPVQVTRLTPQSDRFKVEAEEVLFAADNDDPNVHQIVIDADTTNVNLRAVHDSIYSAPESGNEIICRILNGVKVTSTGRLLPSFDVGTWPDDVTITLIVEGDIRAAGGSGGNNYFPGAIAGQPGLSGGAALYTRQAINLELPAGGKLWGGGGGGGGGGAISLNKYAGGGGGGGGDVPGSGGAGAYYAGAAGTDTAGGGGSPGEPGTYAGGGGGGPGQAGGAGAGYNSPGGAGGAAGRSIDGDSYVNKTVTGGDQRGPAVN